MPTPHVDADTNSPSPRFSEPIHTALRAGYPPSPSGSMVGRRSGFLSDALANARAEVGRLADMGPAELRGLLWDDAPRVGLLLMGLVIRQPGGTRTEALVPVALRAEAASILTRVGDHLARVLSGQDATGPRELPLAERLADLPVPTERPPDEDGDDEDGDDEDGDGDEDDE